MGQASQAIVFCRPILANPFHFRVVCCCWFGPFFLRDPLTARVSLFISLTVCLLVEFWWFFKAGTLMHVRALGLTCETLAASGLGFTQQPENSIFVVSGASNTRIPREDTQRDKKSEMVAGEGKKKAKFWVVRGRGGVWGSKKTLTFLYFRACLGVVLDIREGQPRPLKLTFFLGGEVVPPHPPSFLSAGPPPRP